MQGWESRHFADVMGPALSGVVLRNVMVRYGLTDVMLVEPELFRSQIDAVVNLWLTRRGDKTYGKAAEALLVAHEKLERSGALDDHDALKAWHEKAVSSAFDRLLLRLDDIARTAKVITPTAVQALLDGADGLLDERRVRSALAERNVLIVEARPLPTQPHKKYKVLKSKIAVLGLGLYVELLIEPAILSRGFRIFDEFSLVDDPSLRLDDKLVKDAKAEWRKRPHGDARKSAADDTLAILEEVAKKGRLDEVLLWELMDGLKGKLDDGLPPRVLVADLHDRGLVVPDAELLVLSVMHEAGADRPPPIVIEIEDALAGGELRRAQRLAATFTGTSDSVAPVLDRVTAGAAQVDELVRRADATRDEGDTENAVLLLTEAAGMAQDDEELRLRIDMLAPPPPTGARVVVDGDEVVLAWTASGARVGSVSYRVVRQIGRPPSSASDGVVVADTANAELRHKPPAVVPVYYGVFASRGPRAFSAGSTVGPVRLTPEVSDVKVTAGESSVAVSWRSHPDAVAVHVVRRKQAAPASPSDGEAVASTSLIGFTDAQIQPGTTYYYRISAVYVGPDGARFVTPGCVAFAIAELHLLPVHDLVVTMDEVETDAVRLEWTPAPYGSVSIRSSARPPTWSFGDRVALNDVNQHGSPVAAAPRLDHGRMRAVVPAGSSRSFLTAFTCGQQKAVVGRTVEVCVATPVRKLTAERFGDAARLSWVWPAGATAATIEWRQHEDAGGVSGSIDCLRETYEREGGFEVVVGPRPVALRVQALVNHPGGPVRSAFVEVRLAPRPVSIRYRLIRSGWRGRLVLVEFSSGEPCDVPPTVLLHQSGRVMPQHPSASEGTVLSRLDAVSLDGTSPVLTPTEPVRLPRALAEGWLLCLMDPPSTTVRLVPPPAAELRVS